MELILKMTEKQKIFLTLDRINVSLLMEYLKDSKSMHFYLIKN